MSTVKCCTVNIYTHVVTMGKGGDGKPESTQEKCYKADRKTDPIRKDRAARGHERRGEMERAVRKERKLLMDYEKKRVCW